VERRGDTGGIVARLRPEGELAWWAWAALAVFPGMLGLVHLGIGLRPEHFVLTGVFAALSLMGPGARRFVVMGAPMWCTGLAYDFLRLVTHLRPEVHVADLWHAERRWFGVELETGRVAWADLVASSTHPVLDAITGGVYILYLIAPFSLATYLYFRDYDEGWRLSLGFLAASLLGWVIWLAWPAAPPWYVDTYGLGPADPSALPSAAGAARFDELFGIRLLTDFYSKSSNVFGAMPSLHAGYGLLPLLATWRIGGKLRAAAAVWAALMCYAAVYLRHHYVLDVVAGLLVVVVADQLVGLVLARRKERISAQSTQSNAPNLPTGASA
jgi:inositol phosphorylceramide synthase catalytic subunit